MVLNYIPVKGYIRNGKLHLELPDNVEDGEVEVLVPVGKVINTSEMNSKDASSLDEPSTLGQILDYVLAHAGDELAHIEDEVGWVEEQRRIEEERRSSWMAS